MPKGCHGAATAGNEMSAPPSGDHHAASAVSRNCPNCICLTIWFASGNAPIVHVGGVRAPVRARAPLCQGGSMDFWLAS